MFKKALTLYLALAMPFILLADGDTEEENIGTESETQLLQQEEEGKTADWEVAVTPAGIVFAIVAVAGVLVSALTSDGKAVH